MQVSGTKSKAHTVSSTRHRSGRYIKVLDGRKWPVRGLWRRGDRFHIRLRETAAEHTKQPAERSAFLPREMVAAG